MSLFELSSRGASRELRAQVTRSRLVEALLPLGIEAGRPPSKVTPVLTLALHLDRKKVGFAIVLGGSAALQLNDTVWIGLRTPLRITLPDYASAARMWAIINDRLIAALRPGKSRVRKAPTGEHRDMFCTNLGATHARFAITPHTRVRSNPGRWRCDDCQFDVVVPWRQSRRQ